MRNVSKKNYVLVRTFHHAWHDLNPLLHVLYFCTYVLLCLVGNCEGSSSSSSMVNGPFPSRSSTAMGLNTTGEDRTETVGWGCGAWAVLKSADAVPSAWAGLRWHAFVCWPL